jgi:hypothetical protein
MNHDQLCPKDPCVCSFILKARMEERAPQRSWGVNFNAYPRPEIQHDEAGRWYLTGAHEVVRLVSTGYVHVEEVVSPVSYAWQRAAQINQRGASA